MAPKHRASVAEGIAREMLSEIREQLRGRRRDKRQFSRACLAATAARRSTLYSNPKLVQQIQFPRACTWPAVEHQLYSPQKLRRETGIR